MKHCQHILRIRLIEYAIESAAAMMNIMKAMIPKALASTVTVKMLAEFSFVIIPIIREWIKGRPTPQTLTALKGIVIDQRLPLFSGIIIII